MTKESRKGLDRRALLSAPVGLAAAAGAAATASPAAAHPGAFKPGWIKPEMMRGYAPGPFGLIHYRDTGGDGRPLIMFHQSPMSSQQYNQVYPLLKAQGIRAIGVDTPGFGYSDVTPGVPRVEDWATSYPAVLDYLGIKKADVLGHHTGATIATAATLAYPDRVRKMVIHSALMVTEEERAARTHRPEPGAAVGPAYAMDGSHLSKAFLNVLRRYNNGTPTPADPKVITKFVLEQYAAYGPSWYGHYAAYVYDHGAALKKVRHPAMLLCNTGDNIFALASRLRTVRPDFTYTELQGGGIDVLDHLPQEWANAVAKFLNA